MENGYSWDDKRKKRSVRENLLGEQNWIYSVFVCFKNLILLVKCCYFNV